MGKWEMVRLGDYVEQIRGVSYKPEDTSDFEDDAHLPLLRAHNIQQEGLNTNNLVYVNKKRIREHQYIRKGDIVVCASSGSKELVGKAAQSTIKMNAAFGAFCKVVRPQEGIDSAYLKHYFSSPRYRYIISELSAGANINNLRNEHIDDLRIPLPPLEVQQQIADVLDSANVLIEMRKAQIDRLDLLVKSQFIEMFGDPVMNPKKWKKVKLSAVADIKIGPFGSLLHKEDYIKDGHALVNPSHIVDEKIVIDDKLTITDDKYQELSSYVLHPNDIVLGRRGEMGRCAVVQQEGLLCGTGSMIIRPNGQIGAYFLQKILSYPTFKKAIEDKAVGVTMKNLNIPIVSNLDVPLLSKELQSTYIAIVDQIEVQKSLLQQSLTKLELNYKSLMQKCFCGKVF